MLNFKLYRWCDSAGPSIRYDGSETVGDAFAGDGEAGAGVGGGEYVYWNGNGHG